MGGSYPNCFFDIVRRLHSPAHSTLYVSGEKSDLFFWPIVRGCMDEFDDLNSICGIF